MFVLTMGGQCSYSTTPSPLIGRRTDNRRKKEQKSIREEEEEEEGGVVVTSGNPSLSLDVTSGEPEACRDWCWQRSRQSRTGYLCSKVQGGQWL